MTMPKIAAKPLKPDWFVKRDYLYLQKHGTRGWLKELTRLREQAIKHNPELLKDDRKVEVHHIAGNPRVLLPGAPIVQLVAPQAQDVHIPQHLLPALIVNISAPDTVILAQFKRQLEKARNLFPAPVAKRGRHAPNSIFDTDTFEKWRREKIVQFADLIAWKATLSACEQAAYTDKLLGTWLDRHTSKDVSVTRRTLRMALANLPSLAAQVRYDKHPERRVADLREAEAMEDAGNLQIASEWAKDM
jgi:hypothetical protein